ncbi:bifunctional diaminohydroxyphosphoribosylaminopyrimidine deaminase/5-amino-6-(5-phosphoribosylamino)uracil reductase RibD [uncultured Methylovirgula sp.]|uniref:bifunctional diaminohydroxyphosphoribosylaminopyrimidine deaminase/5-amino-6-(5-phosphoribosylamino)uracil reductase RibD n=1 Tax=uncultured Methylovirgula sp. TaxID=1285960 RepID=UPI0026230E11|nr:bifunctional diaminohydroxyphosphoribosylaminopyrimidine deaminase/5-amino-6-(5-phosphoribosylamino)uracil reductase RibD [uncultured Methylovirgula sp.]
MSAPPGVADIIAEDRRFMAAALNFARRGLGRVAPNPAVGALIVKDGIIIGRGATAQGGRPHAEVLALQEAGAAARGATLYVTLEPCSHFGRTPPCADAVIAAGIARVVSALDDPDPRVAGQGHARLRAAGIDVATGVLAVAARRANLGHILRVTEGRPMLTLKLAETADGFAAGPVGAARLKITGEAANGRVHMLRALHDGVMVGVGTALADDPQLSVRLPGLEDRRPLRIVLDSHLRLPPTAQLAATAQDYPTLVIAAEGAAQEVEARLVAQGVDVVRVKADAAGHVSLNAALALLGACGLTRIFCEGGPYLAAALIEQRLADEVIIFQSSLSLGKAGLPALDAASRAALAEATRYRELARGHAGEDSFVEYERII